MSDQKEDIRFVIHKKSNKPDSHMKCRVWFAESGKFFSSAFDNIKRANLLAAEIKDKRCKRCVFSKAKVCTTALVLTKIRHTSHPYTVEAGADQNIFTAKSGALCTEHIPKTIIE